MKKWLAFLMTVVLLLTTGILPANALNEKQTGAAENTVYVFTEADNQLLEDDVFARIHLVEQVASVNRGGFRRMTEQDYKALIPHVMQAVASSATYLQGTLQRNGDFLVWQTTVGIPCCYDPRMEAIQNGSAEMAEPEQGLPEDSLQSWSDVFTEPVRGGFAESLDIGLIQPYWESNSNYADASFVSYSPYYKTMWQHLYEATGGQGVRYSMGNANIDNIASAVEQCGLVVFDSHGTTDYAGSFDDYTSRANCSYLCLTTSAGITSADTAPQTGPFGTYYHCMKGNGYCDVSGTCIANHMQADAPHSLVYMGICLGMATDGMFKGLREKGVETVWGYSQSVTFSGEKIYMQSILGYLKDGDDFAAAVSKTKAQYGKWDPAYSSYTEAQARSQKVAFPICVSTEDAYPGHGNVDRVQTVYSTWTLFSQYTISAVPNNPEWGTVSLLGNTITAAPAVGYEVNGYDVQEGTATVIQNGNSFTVTPKSDCTIRINFAPRTPAVVTFSVPEGVTCGQMNAYVGDEITLPEPEGSPAVTGRSYRFLGWTASPVTEDTQTLPEYLTVGGKVTLNGTETVYYALYTYFVANDGLREDDFVRVDTAPASWAGDYVITYDGRYALNATKDTIRTNIGTSKAVVDLAAAGCVREGNLLRNVTNNLVYTIAPAPNGTYTVKMKSVNYYLAMDQASSSLTTYTSSNTDKTRWLITMSETGPILTNAGFPDWWLQYHAGNRQFRCFNASNEPLTLFARADGDAWYTTVPKDRPVCETHSYCDWNVAEAATCTNPGSRFRFCTVCGTRETETIEPLGHDYQSAVTAPGCTTPGYTTYTCARCGDTYDGAQTDALGHKWDNGVITAAPTVTEEGIRTFTCERCQATRTETVPALTFRFEDVTDPEAVYFEPVYWAYYHDPQITAGMDATHFGTERTVTRAQAMVFLWAAKGKPEPKSNTNPFTDVKSGKWYTTAILWAAENGITSGTGNGKFSPNKTCNRGEILTFLYAAMKKPSYSIPNPYLDVENKWYRPAAIWAYENGIEKGENGYFNYKTNCTRSDVVVYLYRCICSAAPSVIPNEVRNPFPFA